ncbi:MAG: UDP-N-acetylmuramoyl-tripeptide--D-alanyl-D-alanine ligase [Rikenellaceae bacterium]
MREIEVLYNIYVRHPHISTDTRNIAPSSLFFALRGATFDGNDYALGAIEGGAAHAVVDRVEIFDAAQKIPELRGRVTLVDDTLVALQQLAAHHRKVLGIRVLAISGSNGKTTTKELLASVLSTRYNVSATRGNLNNHIGVPLTLLAIEPGCEIAIVEMGASSCGEIALLCSIARPDYGILTNVGRAHLEGFGGEVGVRRGKGELFDYLAASGALAIVAVDNEIISTMAEERRGLHISPYNYSLADGVDHHLEGDYNRFNVAAAVAVGREFAIDESDICAAIEAYIPENNRSQRVVTERNTLIVDCYNANPSSMEASICNFGSEEFGDTLSKVMILGDMYELGEWSASEHRRVVELATRSDAESIYLVGSNFASVASAASATSEASATTADSRVIHFEVRDMLECELRDNPLSGCAVLIKGSRGVGLENIISLL